MALYQSLVSVLGEWLINTSLRFIGIPGGLMLSVLMLLLWFALEAIKGTGEEKSFLVPLSWKWAVPILAVVFFVLLQLVFLPFSYLFSETFLTLFDSLLTLTVTFIVIWHLGLIYVEKENRGKAIIYGLINYMFAPRLFILVGVAITGI